jgi:8-hydroxy-5-deazaflavin:NADPH oxidoreductase
MEGRSMGVGESRGDLAGYRGSVGIVGGTGALGRGLSRRWAVAGMDVRVGSRDEHRAQDAAAAIRKELDGRPGCGSVTGGTNRAVVAAETLVVLAVPLAGLEASLAELDGLLDGRIVVCAVNPLGFDDRGPHVVVTPMASVAEAVAAAAPEARVVAAFHTVSSRELGSLHRPMDDDVPVVGDDENACAEVVALADRIEGCRGVAAGPLRLAGCLEALTPVLITVNQRRSAHVGVRFSRLPPGTEGPGAG